MIRCDKCGKEVAKERGSKVEIKTSNIFMTRDFQMDLCGECTKEIREKTIKLRKEKDQEREREYE